MCDQVKDGESGESGEMVLKRYQDDIMSIVSTDAFNKYARISRLLAHPRTVMIHNAVDDTISAIV